MEANSENKGFWAKIKPDTNTKWAVWTICVGAFLSIILPALLSQFYWKFWGDKGVNFHDTGQVGDTIGGVAGPILNFAGLLVVYFSLREQAKSTADQKEQFEKDQIRSENENVLGTALKLLDDLKIEVEKLLGDQTLSQHNSTAQASITNNLELKFRNNLANNTQSASVLFRHLPAYEYTGVAIKGRENILKDIVSRFFKTIELRFARLTILLEIFTYLIENSKLPTDVKAMVYSMAHTLVAGFAEDALGVSMIFRQENGAVNILINKIIKLDKLLIKESKIASAKV